MSASVLFTLYPHRDPIFRALEVIKAQGEGQNSVEKEQKRYQIVHGAGRSIGHTGAHSRVPAYQQVTKFGLSFEGRNHV